MTTPTTTPEPEAEFGTSWLRALVLAVPALAVAGVLGWMMARGALASTITVQSGTLTLATSGVYGTEFGLTVGNNPVESSTGTITSQRTARIGFSSAKLEGLCLAEPQSIAGQNFTVMLTAGQSDQFSISSGLLIMDVSSIGGGLYGDGEVDLGVSGQDISTLAAPLWPAGNPLGVDTATTPNPFGLQASITDFGPVTGQVRVMQLQQSITLPNLNISVQPGAVSCPTPPAPTNWPTPPS